MFDTKMLLVILVIALVIFGTKRLRSIGSDLGAAVKGFKQAMNEGESEESVKQLKQDKDADFSATAAPRCTVLASCSWVRPDPVSVVVIEMASPGRAWGAADAPPCRNTKAAATPASVAAATAGIPNFLTGALGLA